MRKSLVTGPPMTLIIWFNLHRLANRLKEQFNWPLADANIDPSEIDYINAHGSSTPLNDKIETKVIKGSFWRACL